MYVLMAGKVQEVYGNQFTTATAIVQVKVRLHLMQNLTKLRTHKCVAPLCKIR